MNTLKTLQMGSMGIDVTTQGWASLFSSIQDSNLDLVNLSFRNNNINDERMQVLVPLVSSMSSLSRLSLGGNNQVTPARWQALIGYLQSPTCVLKELDLDGNKVNDDMLDAFTSALTQNKTLKSLCLEGYCIDEDGNDLVTERGLGAVSTLLCNKTSIMDTYTSNHTLCKIYDYDNVSEDFPDDLVLLLELNENKNKVEVARQKILQTHFSTEDSDTPRMQELLDMELQVMPTAIAWIGRPLPIGWKGTNVSGLSLLYNLMRRVPDLFDSSAQKTNVAKSKREMSI